MTMNTTFDYLHEFYGTISATAFVIYLWTVCSFAILSNMFFITMTLTSASLRKYPANYLLVGLCFADTLHCTAHVVGGVAIWTGSITNRGLCEIAGMFVVLTGTGRFGFPAMIAANRYYKISDIPGETASKCSIGRKLFGKRMIIPLMVGWFCLAYLLNVPLVIYHVFGEDQTGFCGARKFTSVLKLASYEISISAVFLCTYTLAGIYYYFLAKWLHRHQATANYDSVVFTRSLMRVMKIETMLPLLSESPVVILIAGQMLLPVLPMWVTRLIVAPYWFAACSAPWITIALVRPFRRRFVELISTAKARALLLRSATNTVHVQ